MKKIAVIVNTDDAYRQSEAVRVALGLTLMDDMMKGKACSDNPENELETLSLEEIAGKLSEYDVVVPY